MSKLNELVLDITLALIQRRLHLTQVHLRFNYRCEPGDGLCHLIARGFLLDVTPEAVNIHGQLLALLERVLLRLQYQLLDEFSRLLNISLSLLLKLLVLVPHKVKVVLLALLESLSLGDAVIEFVVTLLPDQSGLSLVCRYQ